ncbi:MAG: hypothetical protein ACOC3V_00210 [bacterium]
MLKNRFYSTKIPKLVNRPIFRNDYPHEFMNKLTNKELEIYIKEVQDQVKESGITVSKNINYFNKMVNHRIREREEIYQFFKNNPDDPEDNY